MSILFTPAKIGNIEIKNRFVNSATEEAMATDTGELTDKIINRYQKLAKGEVGLIISGQLSVHPLGRTRRHQACFHSDDFIPGLSKLVEAVHKHDAKIVLQLGHAGIQTKKDIIGETPVGPSGTVKNPARYRKMNEDEIHEAIDAFVHAASRAIEAGADGIQLHAAHGYLINQFISPFYNQREDAWGGSEKNRFRFLREIVLGIKKILPEDRALLVKMNTNDYTPQEGMTPQLTLKYSEWMADAGIDGLELSCGTTSMSPWNMCRGDVPVKEILDGIPKDRKASAETKLKNLIGKFDLYEGYNLDTAKLVKPVLGNTSLFAVGGWRTVPKMEEALINGDIDFISMCRPFIREPTIVKRIKQGKSNSTTCKNCNRCLIAIGNDMPVRCYYKDAGIDDE